MKKLLFSVFATCIATLSFSQFNCGDSIFDSGGSTGQYQNNEIDTFYLCPGVAGQSAKLQFSLFNTEANYDFLTIYDSDQAGQNLLGTYSGQLTLGTIIAENPTGCLTLVFTSDNSVVRAGWAALFTCVISPVCLKPTVLDTVSVSDLSAILSWTENSGANSWIIEYGPAGFAIGTGNSVLTNSNPYNLTGLTENTSYSFYVRAHCGGTDTSAYSPVYSFTTDRTPLPAFICGNMFSDVGGANGNYLPNTNDTIVICPTNSGETIQLVFSAFGTEQGYDTLYIYDDNQAGQNLIGGYTGTQSPGIIVAENVTGCLTAVFTSDGSVNGIGWLAQINCVAPITCSKPSNVLVASVSDVAATVSWTNGGSETSWMIEYGPAGFMSGTGTSVLASTNPFDLTGLIGSTDYSLFVSSICAVGDTSYATGPINFSTTSTPIHLYCDETFLDSGLETGNYGYDEDQVHIICPSTAFEYVNLVFSAFDIENNYDFMTIYDANEMIPGTEIGTYTGTTSPGDVPATNTSGCLTIHFTSDDIINSTGWSAYVECIPLAGKNELSNGNLSIYPNPSTGLFNLVNNFDSNISYEVVDMQGRVIISSANLLVNANTNIDLTAYTKGVYFLKVNSNKISNTYSLVKE